MHKSRLGTVVIDCQTEQIDMAAQFWSSALGWPAEPLSDPNNANYRKLNAPRPQRPDFETQANIWGEKNNGVA